MERKISQGIETKPNRGLEYTWITEIDCTAPTFFTGTQSQIKQTTLNGKAVYWIANSLFFKGVK
jgi:hypothetical protein